MINTPEGFDARSSTPIQLFLLGTALKQVVRSNWMHNVSERNLLRVTDSRRLWAEKYSLRVGATISNYLSTKANLSRSESAGPASLISKKLSQMAFKGGLFTTVKLDIIAIQQGPTTELNWLRETLSVWRWIWWRVHWLIIEMRPAGEWLLRTSSWKRVKWWLLFHPFTIMIHLPSVTW